MIKLSAVGSVLEADGGSVPSAFSGRKKKFLDNPRHQPTRKILADTDLAVAWAREVESLNPIPAKFVELRFYRRDFPVFWEKCEYTQVKHIPEKRLDFPFGILYWTTYEKFSGQPLTQSTGRI